MEKSKEYCVHPSRLAFLKLLQVCHICFVLLYIYMLFFFQNHLKLLTRTSTSPLNNLECMYLIKYNFISLLQLRYNIMLVSGIHHSD